MTTASHATDMSARLVRARFDRIPVLTRKHWGVLWMLGALGIFDGFDLAAFGYTAPAIRQELGLSLGEVGWIASSVYVGSFVGALIGGRLADSRGRRPVLFVSVVLYSLGSLCTVFAANAEMLIACRVVTGVGAQALTVVSYLYLSEMFPAKFRGRCAALLLGISVLGVPLAAVLTWTLVPDGGPHWRWIYGIGTLGLLVVVAVRRLPESVRWQLRTGDLSGAESTVAAFEREAVAKTGTPLPEPTTLPEVETGQASLRELASGLNLRRLIVVTVSMVLFAYVIYGFNTWLTTLLVERGYSQRQALTAAVAISLAGFAGSVGSVLFADRVERKKLVLAVMVLDAALLLVFGLVDSLSVTVVVGVLLSGTLQIALAAMYAYTPEIFPTHLRGLGSGIVGGAFRLSAAFTSVTVGLVLSGFGFVTVFVVFAAVAVLFGAFFFVLGARTKGRSLEDIAADGRGAGE
ncbi:MFS transporter [Lentzea sp. JNUCC 0626]|uniref:MFS transporter n=1 Tax=Lentzea sp. JNUCC 0626 TaxID=3367513 RepID=UPI00374A7696